jgi:hypothetical protein
LIALAAGTICVIEHLVVQHNQKSGSHIDSTSRQRTIRTVGRQPSKQATRCYRSPSSPTVQHWRRIRPVATVTTLADLRIAGSPRGSSPRAE